MAAATPSNGAVPDDVVPSFDCEALRSRQELEARLVAQLESTLGETSESYVLQCLKQLGYPDSVKEASREPRVPPVISAAASEWRKLCDDIEAARLGGKPVEEEAAAMSVDAGEADPPNVAGEDDGMVDWSSGSVEDTVSAGKHDAPGLALCLYGGGDRAVSIDDRGEMIFWDVSVIRASAAGGGAAAAAGRSCEVNRIRAHVDVTYGLRVSPDESLIATGCMDGSVKLWTADGDAVRTLRDEPDGRTNIWSVCFSADGKSVLVAADDEEALLEFDVEGVRAVRVIPAGGQLFAVDASANGQWVITTGRETPAKIWDGATLTEICALDGSSSCRGARFSPDSSHVAVVGDDQHLRVWQTSDWSKTIDIEAHPKGTYRVCWSSDSKQIVTSSGDATVKVWEASSGRLLRTLAGHTSTTWGVAMSTDGKMIMSNSYDKTVRVWRHEE